MLGSRKLLIFGIVSALLLSLVTVGAFAAEPEDVKALGGGGVVKSPPTYAAPPSYLFRTQYCLISKSNNLPAQLQQFTVDSPLMAHYVYIKDADNHVVELFFEDDVPVYRTGSLVLNEYSTFVVDGVSYSVRNAQFSCYFCSFSSIPSIDVHYRQYYDVVTDIATLGSVQAVFESILGIGTSLVAFVVARPIVLVPIVAMILVLGLGVIRRLIKGV